jgi:hypothetical protein
MPKKKQSSRGRKQDRARVAGGQDYEVRYAAKKSGKSNAAVKRASRKSAIAGSATLNRHRIGNAKRHPIPFEVRPDDGNYYRL